MQPNNILFRAKHLKADYYDGDLIPEGRWLYGWYYQNQCNGNVEHNIILPREKGSQGQAGLAIDPNTLCQFTGLHDVHGKQIFEGDIITVNGNYPRVVLWDKTTWALMPTEYYHDKDFWVMNLQHPGIDWWEEFADTFEIIGNVFDNPELLK